MALTTAEVLRQLLPQAEQEQQLNRSLQAANADLERRLTEFQAENARLKVKVARCEAENASLQCASFELRHAAGVDQEEIKALRNVLGRERAEKKEVQQRLAAAEQRQYIAVHEAAQARQAAQKADLARLRSEDELARVESTRDAVIEKIEEDAQIRMDQAEEDAQQSREEAREIAKRLMKERRRRRAALKQLHQTTDELHVERGLTETMREQKVCRECNQRMFP